MSFGMRFFARCNCFHFAKKKWKAKEFAAAVDRAEIEHYAQAIGVTLDQHIQTVLTAMKANAEALGL